MGSSHESEVEIHISNHDIHIGAHAQANITQEAVVQQGGEQTYRASARCQQSKHVPRVEFQLSGFVTKPLVQIFCISCF